MSTSVDIDSLPIEVREKLAELDLELSEGDITQKGYEKKRARLLAPFLSSSPMSPSSAPHSGGGGGGPSSQPSCSNQASGSGGGCLIGGPSSSAAGGAASPSTRAKRRHHRRVTRHESRYHSGTVHFNLIHVDFRFFHFCLSVLIGLQSLSHCLHASPLLLLSPSRDVFF